MEPAATTIPAAYSEDIYDDFGVVSGDTQYYRKEHADAFIAEKDAEIAELKRQLDVMNTNYVPKADIKYANEMVACQEYLLKRFEREVEHLQKANAHHAYKRSEFTALWCKEMLVRCWNTMDRPGGDLDDYAWAKKYAPYWERQTERWQKITERLKEMMTGH